MLNTRHIKQHYIHPAMSRSYLMQFIIVTGTHHSASVKYSEELVDL